MIRTILIEDKRMQRKFLSELIQDHFPQLSLVGIAGDILTGIRIINDYSPDLILLGSRLKDGTGFSVLRAIKSYAYMTIVLAETEDYAIQAMRLNVLDYILKPVTKEKLMEVINKVDAEVIKSLSHKLASMHANLIESKKRRVVLRTSDKIHLIPIHMIIRCEANRNYADFYLSNGNKITICTPLKAHENMLEANGFFRIHKSHIVNLDFVDTYFRSDGGHVLLSDGVKLPVADRKKASLFEIFKNI